MYRTLFVLFIGLNSFTAFSQVLINEIQSTNTTTIQDAYNGYSDWIELFNSYDSTVNLSGWSLSDDKTTWQKWVFPNSDFGVDIQKVVYK